jgi:hypothetical protein
MNDVHNRAALAGGRTRSQSLHGQQAGHQFDSVPEIHLAVVAFVSGTV